MAYFVDRTVKMTWWERSYLPAIITGMYITSRHFFINLLGFVPFFLGQKKIDKRNWPIFFLGKNNFLGPKKNMIFDCQGTLICESTSRGTKCDEKTKSYIGELVIWEKD